MIFRLWVVFVGNIYFVRYQVLTAASIKMTAIWDIAVCSRQQTDVLDMRSASIITAMMEAVRTSETSVYFNETTQHYILESCYL
jgi:hypothetical protein